MCQEWELYKCLSQKYPCERSQRASWIFSLCECTQRKEHLWAVILCFPAPRTSRLLMLISYLIYSIFFIIVMQTETRVTGKNLMRHKAQSPFSKGVVHRDRSRLLEQLLLLSPILAESWVKVELETRSVYYFMVCAVFSLF